jgi:hypothetical protein
LGNYNKGEKLKQLSTELRIVNSLSDQEKEKKLLEIEQLMDKILVKLQKKIKPIDNTIRINPYLISDGKNLELLLIETDRIIGQTNEYLKQNHGVKINMIINLSFSEDWSYMTLVGDNNEIIEDIHNNYWFDYWTKFLLKFNIPIIFLIFACFNFDSNIIKHIDVNRDT